MSWNVWGRSEVIAPCILPLASDRSDWLVSQPGHSMPSALPLPPPLPSEEKNVIQITAGARDLSLPQKGQTRSGAHSASYSMGTRNFFPTSKALGAWGWPCLHLASSDGNKNEWRCTTISSECLHGLYGGNFIILILNLMIGFSYAVISNASLSFCAECPEHLCVLHRQCTAVGTLCSKRKSSLNLNESCSGNIAVLRSGARFICIVCPSTPSLTVAAVIFQSDDGIGI